MCSASFEIESTVSLGCPPLSCVQLEHKPRPQTRCRLYPCLLINFAETSFPRRGKKRVPPPFVLLVADSFFSAKHSNPIYSASFRFHLASEMDVGSIHFVFSKEILKKGKGSRVCCYRICWHPVEKLTSSTWDVIEVSVHFFFFLRDQNPPKKKKISSQKRSPEPILLELLWFSIIYFFFKWHFPSQFTLL